MPKILESKVYSHSSKKGSMAQIKEPEVASNHRKVGQASYCPMEALCHDLWGHPIRDEPLEVMSTDVTLDQWDRASTGLDDTHWEDGTLTPFSTNVWSLKEYNLY